MKIRVALLIGLAALPLAAGNIDVSGQTTVFLNTGEVLYFAVPDWNFVADANILGVSQYPSAVAFQFLTAPIGGATDFTVSLESSDGSASVAFPGSLSFTPGTFAGSLYSGPVSELSGTLNLPASVSAQIFGGSSALLAVYNAGAPVTLGLPPYTSQQDLQVSLEGSGLSVGAPQGSVTLDPPGAPQDSAMLEPAGVPEPQPALLVLAGLIVVAVIPATRKRAP
jgi:hypothetical protein